MESLPQDSKYKDIVPTTHNERMFAIGAMLVSAGTYAFLIANMSSIVAQMNFTKGKYNERLNELNAYMNSREVPAALQLRIRRYYRYYLQRKTVHNESTILEELSTNLREELTDHYVKATIRNIHFFQGLTIFFSPFRCRAFCFVLLFRAKLASQM